MKLGESCRVASGWNVHVLVGSVLYPDRLLVLLLAKMLSINPSTFLLSKRLSFTQLLPLSVHTVSTCIKYNECTDSVN